MKIRISALNGMNWKNLGTNRRYITNSFPFSYISFRIVEKGTKKFYNTVTLFDRGDLMNIAVCDDNPMVLKEITHLIDDFAEKRGIFIRYDT